MEPDDIGDIEGIEDVRLTLPLYLFIQVRESGKCFMLSILKDNVGDLFGHLEPTDNNLYKILHNCYGPHTLIRQSGSEFELIGFLIEKVRKHRLLKMEFEFIELLLEDYPEHKI